MNLNPISQNVFSRTTRNLLSLYGKPFICGQGHGMTLNFYRAIYIFAICTNRLKLRFASELYITHCAHPTIRDMYMFSFHMEGIFYPDHMCYYIYKLCSWDILTNWILNLYTLKHYLIDLSLTGNFFIICLLMRRNRHVLSLCESVCV